MSKRAKDRPESIKIRVITPEGRYQTVEVTRTDMKKSLAAKVLAETGSLAKAAKKSGIPLWGIKSWYRDSKSFQKMYRWSLEQSSWRKRTREWLRHLAARLGYLVTQAFDKLRPVKWWCSELYQAFYWWVSSFFEAESEAMSVQEATVRHKEEFDRLKRIGRGNKANDRTVSS